MSVRCVDRQSLDDVRVFLERAERLGASSVRVQIFDDRLVSTVPVLTPRGLVDSTPLIIGMRVSPVEATDPTDTVVAIRALLERIARFAPGENGPLELPAARLSESWAGIAPPRTGWLFEREIAISTIAQLAEHTLEPLASVSSTQPEKVLANALRRESEELGAPAGLAAAAQSLGFLAGREPARLTRIGRWTRLSTAYGHALARV